MSFETEYQNWLGQENLELYLREQLEKMTEAEKEDAFYRNLEFGTGGMRGVVGPGTNRMNVYTIRKANEGFAQYLLKNVENAKERGIVIAYDCRHFSPEFAMESAKVMASHGIKAYVFETLRPTPELSFAVRHLQAAGGIVVTASHNPPEYNGYKIYDETGCQLVPADADQVIALVDAIDDVFAIDVKSEEELKAAGLIQIIGKEIDDVYTERVKALEINPDCNKKDLKIVLKYEKSLYLKKKLKMRIGQRLAGSYQPQIYRYIVHLRKEEYFFNAKSGFIKKIGYCYHKRAKRKNNRLV